MMNTTDTAKVEVPGSKLYDQDIYTSTLSYKDVQEITLIQSTADELKFYELIGRHLNFPVRKLTVNDFKYLLYWQRINSYQNFPIVLKWDCSKCNSSNETNVSANDLVVKDIHPEYEDYAEVKLFNGKTVKFRMQTVGDNAHAIEYCKNRNIKQDDRLLDDLRLAGMLEPTNADFEERLSIVQSLSADDYILLKNLESDLDYGVEEYVNCTCSHCGHKTRVEFRFHLFRFFPSFQDRRVVRDRVLFSKKSKVESNDGSKSNGVQQVDLDEKQTSTGSDQDGGSSQPEKGVTQKSEQKVAKVSEIVK